MADLFKTLLPALGMGAGALFGGPAGAAVGGGLGSALVGGGGGSGSGGGTSGGGAMRLDQTTTVSLDNYITGTPINIAIGSDTGPDGSLGSGQYYFDRGVDTPLVNAPFSSLVGLPALFSSDRSAVPGLTRTGIDPGLEAVGPALGDGIRFVAKVGAIGVGVWFLVKAGKAALT